VVFLASLRLGERLFFQAIDDTGNAFFDQRRVEVDEEAKALIGQAQIGQKLLFVNRRENFDRFDLDDHAVLDNQVRPEPGFEPDRSLYHWDCLLADRPQSTLSKFISKHRMVNRRQ
jgi:hypothetical protein